VAKGTDESPERPEERGAFAPYAPIAHLAFVAAAAVAVYSFVSVARESETRRRCTPTCLLRPNYAGHERKAPSFALKDAKGKTVTLDDYRGKVVVLNFWTKTCGPCMEEMPEIADLTRILAPKSDVAVVTVSTDETGEDAYGTLKAVLREEPPFPILMDPELTVVRDKFGTSLYPETWSSATVVELVEQLRGGSYCHVEARDGKFVGDGARLCENLSGG